MRKRDDRVIDVRPHKKGKWRIRYSRGGRTMCEYRATEESAHTRADALREELAGKTEPPKEQPHEFQGGGASSDWIRILWHATVEVMKDKRDEDAQRRLRTVSQAARAAAPHMDREKVERKVAKLEHDIEEITFSRRRTGTSKKADGVGVRTHRPPTTGGTET